MSITSVPVMITFLFITFLLGYENFSLTAAMHIVGAGAAYLGGAVDVLYKHEGSFLNEITAFQSEDISLTTYKSD